MIGPKEIDLFIDRIEVVTKRIIYRNDKYDDITVTLDRYIKEGRGGNAAATLILDRNGIKTELIFNILEVGWSWGKMGVTILSRGDCGFIPIYSRIDSNFELFFTKYYPRIIQNSIDKLINETSNSDTGVVPANASEASSDDYVSSIRKWKRKAKDILSFSKKH